MSKLFDEVSANIPERVKEKEWWKDGGFAVSGRGIVDYFKPTALDFYQQGRMFKTKEEAENFSEKERLLAEISREDGVRPFVPLNFNWYIYYDHRKQKWDILYDIADEKPNTIYFELEWSVRKVIEKYGDRLNILL